jgi:hypothetical protein
MLVVNLHYTKVDPQPFSGANGFVEGQAAMEFRDRVLRAVKAEDADGLAAVHGVIRDLCAIGLLDGTREAEMVASARFTNSL